jgi:glycosyltransferase involved in cell wall biosynthesis
MKSNKKKSKILFIHHGGSKGGAFISLLTIINNLNKEKYLPKVVLLQNSISTKSLEENSIEFVFADHSIYRRFKYFFIHSAVGPVKWYKILYFIKVFIYWILSANFYAPRIIRKEAPDIVHINSSVLSDWVFAAKKVNVKNVIHIREPIANGYIGFRKKILQLILRKNANHIIAISKDNASRVNNPQKITIIYDAVDTGKKIATINSYSSKAILYAGGTDLHKGFLTLAESIEYINKDIKIYIAGIIHFPKRNFWQPSYRVNKYKIKLYNKLKEHDNVEFIGFTNDIETLLSKCTLSISSFSVPHCSMLVLESYSMRKPVIGSDVEGMDEIIDHGKSGLLFSVNDSLSLANAINEICLDPHKAKEMGEYGYHKYISEFALDGNSKIEYIYNNLINEK